MTVIELSTRREYVKVVRCADCGFDHPADLHKQATNEPSGDYKEASSA